MAWKFSRLVKIGYLFRKSGGKKGRKIDKFVRESIDRLSNLTKGVSTKGVLVVVLALLVYSPFFAKKSMHLRYSVSRNPQRWSNVK